MASKSYMIVCGEGDSGAIRGALEAAVGPLLDPGTRITDFKLPQGSAAPKFGTVDNLVKLTDDLAKYDTQCEGALRRLERQYVETFETEEEKHAIEQDGDSHFKVFRSGEATGTSIEAYLREGWNWDEGRFSGQNRVEKNLEHLLDGVSQLDEQSRNKGQAYSDVKAQKNSLTKKEGVTFPTRDLVDLLHPGAVNEGDFVETEHLTTVVVILGRGQEADFKKWYENPEVRSIRMKDGKEEEHVDKIEPPQTVIPNSAQQFTKLTDGKEDKDGNTVWRVVLFRSCKDKFQSLARQNKFTVRDFEYDSSASSKLEVKRKEVEKQAEDLLHSLKKSCQLAWSDVFTSWLHIKALRAYVETILRFGKGPKIQLAGFIMCPKSVTPQLREGLARALPGKGADMSDDGEEYFAYWSAGFAPRTSQGASA